MTPGGSGDRDEASAPPDSVEPPATVESAATEPTPAGAATQPTAAGGRRPARVEPVRPVFEIDSWLEAPPGTFPGLAEAPDDDLDRAFAADRFREYEHDVLPDAEPAPEPAGVSPRGMGPAEAAARIRRPDRVQVLVGACVAVIVVLALVASFAGGRAAARLDDPVAGRTPAPVPTAPAGPRVPVSLAAPGIQPWDRLAGGECLQGFTTPWAESFSVVPCTQQHTAQLLLRARFPDSAKAAYPGATALQQRMAALCTAPSVVDLERAAAVSDLQLFPAYPATREQWQSGDRDYFCFVSRQSGAPIDGSVAGTAQRAVWATRAPRPEPTTSSGPAP